MHATPRELTCTIYLTDASNPTGVSTVTPFHRREGQQRVAQSPSWTSLALSPGDIRGHTFM